MLPFQGEVDHDSCLSFNEDSLFTSLKRDERGGDVAESTSVYDMWCVKREVVVAVVRAALQDVLCILYINLLPPIRTLSI